jgi:hypothetical protein
LKHAPNLAFEKEILARYGLSVTETDIRGALSIKIFEENKEITRWLQLLEFQEWVQGFIYAMRRRETGEAKHLQ